MNNKLPDWKIEYNSHTGKFIVNGDVIKGWNCPTREYDTADEAEAAAQESVTPEKSPDLF